MTTVVIRVVGDPQPKGNKTGFVKGGRVVLVEGRRGKSRAAFIAWKNALESAAREQYIGEPLEGALDVTITLWIRRGKTVKRDRPHVAPDTDKYARAVLDPLTKIVWHDDGQVVDLHASKFYAHSAQAPGCVIAVSEIREST